MVLFLISNVINDLSKLRLGIRKDAVAFLPGETIA